MNSNIIAYGNLSEISENNINQISYIADVGSMTLKENTVSMVKSLSGTIVCPSN